MQPTIILPILNLIISIIEQGPTILNSLSDLVDKEVGSDVDKTQLKERIRKAQSLWKEWT